jgi:hypothetical protein
MGTNIDDEKLNELKAEIEEVKQKMNNNEDYKDNFKKYMRLRNKLRYWTDEEYRNKSMEKSINRSVMVKKYKEFLSTAQIQKVN